MKKYDDWTQPPTTANLATGDPDQVLYHWPITNPATGAHDLVEITRADLSGWFHQLAQEGLGTLDDHGCLATDDADADRVVARLGELTMELWIRQNRDLVQQLYGVTLTD